jgi:p-aminobenzoyl-glutamate transporter AbgT
MIYAAINLLALSVLLLIWGLWKPKTLLFWQENPSRLTVVVICALLVMIGGTMYGEGTRQKQATLAAEAAKNTPASVVAPESDIPSPALIPAK